MTIVTFESFDEEPSGNCDGRLDQLLRQFYEQEVPKPWPFAKRPMPGKSATVHSVRRRSLVALAATLLLTVAGHQLLSRLYTPGIQSPENTEHGRKEAVNRHGGHLHDLDISSKAQPRGPESRSLLKRP